MKLLAAEQLCTCHLVCDLDARQPTVSHHLRVLREAGFVDQEHVGRFTYYRLRPEFIERAAADLSSLAAAARRAEATRRPCA